jgi:uncharacterized RDD family membrane protein YckC
MENYQTEPKATPQHRLGAIALDVVLLLCTCYIGWIIWSLVIWGQGLTPGKQILKLRVVSSVTGQTATWGHMAIRQFLLPMALHIRSKLLGRSNLLRCLALEFLGSFLYGVLIARSFLTGCAVDFQRRTEPQNC